MKTFDELIYGVTIWAHERDLLKQENAHKQMCKVIEELGETSKAMLNGNRPELIDGLGDTFVTLIILCKQLGLEPSFCLEFAYEQIKDRKGQTVGGVFVKEEKR